MRQEVSASHVWLRTSTLMFSDIPSGRGEHEADAGVLTTTSACSAPSGREVDAGTAALHPAGGDPGRSPRDDAPSSCHRPHRRPHALVTTCPCRAPQHPISNVGLIGGGHVPRPRDVSWAHHAIRVMSNALLGWSDLTMLCTLERLQNSQNIRAEWSIAETKASWVSNSAHSLHRAGPCVMAHAIGSFTP